MWGPYKNYGMNLALNELPCRLELRELAAIWTRASNRTAVSVAANYIERSLILDPHRQGVLFGRRNRKLFVSPLAVEYLINDRDQSVTILRVS
jgi:hypothetical protein